MVKYYLKVVIKGEGMKKKKIVNKTVLIIILLSFLVCNFTGCVNDTAGEEFYYENTTTYTGESKNIQTRDDGNGVIVSEEQDITYDVKVVDENGNPVEGYVVNYREEYGDSVFIGFDPEQRYTGSLLRGTVEYFYGEQDGAGDQDKSMAVGLIIYVVINVALVAAATYTMFKVSSEVEEYLYESESGVYFGNLIIKSTLDEFITGFLLQQLEFRMAAIDLAISLATFDPASSGIAAAKKVTKIVVDKVEDKIEEELLKEELRDLIRDIMIGYWVVVNDDYLEQQDLYIVLDCYHNDSKIGKINAEYCIYLEDPSEKSLIGRWNALCTSTYSSNTSVHPVGYSFDAEFYLKPSIDDETALYLYDFIIPTQPWIHYSNQNVGILYNNTFETSLSATIDGYTADEKYIITDIEGAVDPSGLNGDGLYYEELYINNSPIFIDGDIELERRWIDLSQ